MAHVRHVNTSYGRFPLVQSLNIFVVLVSGNPQQNTSALGNLGGTSRNNNNNNKIYSLLESTRLSV